MTPQLAQCTAAEIPRLATIRSARETWMQRQGIDQWLPGSQPMPMLAAQIERGEWFALSGDGPIVAAMRLLDEDPEFWDEDAEPALYVHGLMVDPSASGQGLGATLLDLAGQEATRRVRSRLRLDCAPRLVTYYGGHGFAAVGEKQFPGFTTVLMEREAG